MAKIRFNSQEKTGELDSFVNRILDAIGYPDAYISDETTLYDFGCFSDLTEHQLIKKIRGRFDITVKIKDAIHAIAQKIKECEIRT